MAQKSTPKEAQVMAAILKDMGITEYEPRVINQMLEFTYRYVTDVLDDAKVYSSHANKRNLDVEDVKLAVQCKLDHSFTTPPPRDLLMELASHKNNTALPLIKPYTGPKLPPLERYCLISPNYRLKSLRKVASVRNPVQSGASLLSTLTPASRIAIQQHSGSSSIVRTGSSLGGSLSLVTLGGSQPTVTVKPAAPQTSMPIIRFTPGSTAQTVTSSNSASFTISGSSLKRKREDDNDYDK